MLALAQLHLGSLAAINGERATALDHLSEALERFTALEMPLYIALCAAARARLAGDPDDSALLALGVIDPDAILRAHLAGALR